MNDDIEEQLSKSRTTYRNLHHPPSSLNTPLRIATNDSDEEEEEEEEEEESTLPTFVNHFFSAKNPLNSKSPPPPRPLSTNDTGMFRAIRGQVIIHHDDDRSSKVQCEEEDDDDDEEDHQHHAGLEHVRNNRSNMGNYELHYDVDNPLEISCSMSLSSAETISDHSPSPLRHTSSINIDGKNAHFKKPIELSTSDDDDNDEVNRGHEISSSSSSLTNDDTRDQDEKLRTFRGWHLSMLKQIDEKLREIELETGTITTGGETPAAAENKANANLHSVLPVPQSKKSVLNKKKVLRPTIRRRFETPAHKRQNSPIPQIKVNTYRTPSPAVEKESRTLIINLPPSSSSSSASSASDPEEDFPPPPPAPSEPIHIRIVKSPLGTINQRSQSTERLILRDQSAQTEPSSAFEHRAIRPASVEGDRIHPTRSLTRLQGNQFLRQQQQQQQRQQAVEPIKFYSLRSRTIQSRPSIVTQSPMSKPQLPPTTSITPNRPLSNEKPILPPLPPQASHYPPMPSPDPSVYSDDYGHVTQMDTTNLGSLVDKVFEDIYQDKPSDFYRDYRQLLNDIQIRFSMVSAVEQPPIHHHRPPPPPPVPPIHRSAPPLSPHHPPPPPPLRQQPSSTPQPVFVDYSRVAQPSLPQARLLDTLIYIPNPI